MTRLVLLVPIALLTVCCDKDVGHESGAALPKASGGEPSVKETPPTSSADPTDDPALRRSYTAADMKFHACVKVGEDGVVHGEQCPSAFVVFGPYVLAPGKSDLRVAFEIQGKSKLFVTSDVVSDVGKVFHGAMEEQSLNAGEARKLGYKIHLFGPANAVEARIGIRADAPANFTITNLTISVL